MFKYLSTLIICMLLVGAGCQPSTYTNEANSPQAGMEVIEPGDGPYTIYYSEDCSHCHKVLNYVRSQGIDRTLDMTIAEVSDEKIYREFYERVQTCGIPIHQIGVPMMWDGVRCYRGVEQIEEALERVIEE